jgi:hypothetical protein
MLPSEQRPDQPRRFRDLAKHTAIIVALISSATAIAISLMSYWLIQRQTLMLERIKLDISKSAQKTSETVATTDSARLDSEKQNALINAKIDAARLDLERQNALITQRIETKKTHIEDKKSRTDEARLTQDFSKLSNDLRPNIHIDCDSDYNKPTFIKVTCKFRNNGAHRCKITPLQFNMLDGVTGRLIDKAVSQVEHDESNTILPGGNGSNTYNIWITPNGEKITSRIVRIKYLATTDSQAVDMTRRLAAGYITGTELQDLSQQNYTQNLSINGWFGGN